MVVGPREAVAQLCQFYVSTSQACGHLGHEIWEVHQELTRPSTAEAMLRRGKEPLRKVDFTQELGETDILRYLAAMYIGLSRPPGHRLDSAALVSW